MVTGNETAHMEEPPFWTSRLEGQWSSGLSFLQQAESGDKELRWPERGPERGAHSQDCG